MLVDGVVLELGVAGVAHRVPGVLQAAAAGRHLLGRAVGALHEVAGRLQPGIDPLDPDQGVAAARRDGMRVVGLHRVQGAAPILEMPVAAVAGGVVLDDVAGEHDLLVRHPDDRVAGGMGAADLLDLDLAVAEIDGHRIREGGGRPGQAGDALMALEQAGEALELAVPVLLAALDHHGAGLVRHDDLRVAEGAGAEHADRVVVGQDHMADRLVGDLADLGDDHLGQARGGLGLDDHDAVVADDDARIRVALGGEGPEILADLGEADFLFAKIALACECLRHARPPVHASPVGAGGASGAVGLLARTLTQSGIFAYRVNWGAFIHTTHSPALCRGYRLGTDGHRRQRSPATGRAEALPRHKAGECDMKRQSERRPPPIRRSPRLAYAAFGSSFSTSSAQ